jgi:hypothetical protein
MIATTLIPTLPVALIPAGLMPVAFGLAALALAVGFGALVTAMVRTDDHALASAATVTPVAPLPTVARLSHAA